MNEETDSSLWQLWSWSTFSFSIRVSTDESYEYDPDFYDAVAAQTFDERTSQPTVSYPTVSHPPPITTTTVPPTLPPSLPTVTYASFPLREIFPSLFFNAPQPFLVTTTARPSTVLTTPRTIPTTTTIPATTSVPTTQTDTAPTTHTTTIPLTTTIVASTWPPTTVSTTVSPETVQPQPSTVSIERWNLSPCSSNGFLSVKWRLFFCSSHHTVIIRGIRPSSDPKSSTIQEGRNNSMNPDVGFLEEVVYSVRSI